MMPLKLLILLICISLNACVGTPITGKYDDVLPYHVPPAEYTISVRVSADNFANDDLIDTSSALLERWQNVTIKSFKSSGYFAYTGPYPGQSDIYADVHVKKNMQYDLTTSVLSGATALISPTYTTTNYNTTVVLRDSYGDVIYVGDQNESVRTWYSLFLSPVTAYEGTFDEDRLLANMVLESLNQAKREQRF